MDNINNRYMFILASLFIDLGKTDGQSSDTFANRFLNARDWNVPDQSWIKVSSVASFLLLGGGKPSKCTDRKKNHVHVTYARASEASERLRNI